MNVIEGFTPLGGAHCITNSLRQIFAFNGIPVSEAMLFGLGSGLGFAYVNLADSPMISGRVKPGIFEKTIGKRLSIGMRVICPKDGLVAETRLQEYLRNKKPVMLYVDMAYLRYLNLPRNSHFGGHSVVVFGFDPVSRKYSVSDRDARDSPIHTPNGPLAEDFHMVETSELALARGSNFRPFPANNKWIDFGFSGHGDITSEIILSAIAENLKEMLHAPAQLLGVNGIRKFARALKTWKDFPSHKLKLAGITNYFMICADGGTGGGAFRNLYGDFLLESSAFFPELTASGTEFKRIAARWDSLGLMMKELHRSGDSESLADMGIMAETIADREESAMKEILGIIGPRGAGS